MYPLENPCASQRWTKLQSEIIAYNSPTQIYNHSNTILRIHMYIYIDNPLRGLLVSPTDTRESVAPKYRSRLDTPYKFDPKFDPKTPKPPPPKSSRPFLPNSGLRRAGDFVELKPSQPTPTPFITSIRG